MADDVKFYLDEYLEDLASMFNNLQKECYSLERKAIATGGRYITQQVRRSYNEYFAPPRHHDKSGMPGLEKGEPENLKKSIRNKLYKKPKLGTYITSTAHAWNPYSPDQNKVLYGIALGKGYDLKPKDPDGWLTFPTPDGKWVKRKAVHVDGKPWITAPASRAAESTEVMVAMNKTVQKYLNKLEKNPKYTVEYPDQPEFDFS